MQTKQNITMNRRQHISTNSTQRHTKAKTENLVFDSNTKLYLFPQLSLNRYLTTVT